ncbi:GTPase of the mitochondrial inner membrane that associates with the large ribosomal subunit [Ascosphaera atra]|nr:GTPase of the mitochondrial inner membrane that associates with the large ribosomal subunit [Ascosphaera atra]
MSGLVKGCNPLMSSPHSAQWVLRRVAGKTLSSWNRSCYAAVQARNTSTETSLAHLDPSPTDFSRSPFIDKCSITIRAGNGGNGCVSFLREKFIAEGPANGGNGGTGGNIFIQAIDGQTSLHKLARNRILKAGNGKSGQGKNRGGTRGGDVLITVPVGTVVREVARTDPVQDALLDYRYMIGRYGKVQGPRMFAANKNRWVMHPSSQPSDFFQTSFPSVPPPQRSAIAAMEPPAPIYLDLSQHMERPMLLLSGAVGGQGNPAYVSTLNPRPMFASKGEGGASIDLELELKTLADVGLVGLPNAGKSTLLRSITRSRTRIGNWAFTTLSPNIGTFVIDNHQGRPVIESKLGRQRFTVADIPGLIEGAHLDKGLGLGFLRHVERAGVLAFVVDLSDGDAVTSLQRLWHELNQFQKLREKQINLETENRMYSWEAMKQISLENGYEEEQDMEGEDGEEPLVTSERPTNPFSSTQDYVLPPMYSKPWLVIGTKADVGNTEDNFRRLREYLQAVEKEEAPHPSGEENAWRGKLYSVPVSAINAQGVHTIPEKILRLLEGMHF